MEAPLLREGAFSPEAAYYIDKLARKEEECNEITAQFNKYKVKTKVRFDQLRHEISNILHEKNVDPEDEQQHPAMLLISLNETQFKLEEAEKLSLALRSDVERQQVHINDQIILIKNLEDQLRVWEESEMARERRRNEPVDLERVQQQMMYKDERIVELNSVILDKERQILDLQDACRSASEVATSKKEAMRIVQKKFDEMEKRTRREASTETDDRLTGVTFDGPTHAATTTERAQRSMHQSSQPPQLPRAVRTSSPGRAVHVPTKNGCNSPPPLDPSELDDLPGTSKLAKTNVDGDSSLREKKQRKRVTFALPQAASREDISRLTADADTDEITEALVNLTAENDRLRGEVERVTRMEEEMDEMAIRVAQAESAVSEAEREARHTSLKARAVAQARIKELEDRMATQNALGAQQIDRLQVETETLRSTRDWEVEQNARMREQLAHTKEKLRQLREELDASAQANRMAEKKLDEKESLVTSLVAELEDAESLAVFLEDQKHQILDDVDQLKDIIKLHEEQINLLEADNLIYETRVGHLREELGVSKVNQRDHIKSKAFHTKLQMVNKEKEQIDRKANDERLRTKALHAKVQILEAENERLMARLCEAEMAGEDTSSLGAACKQLQGRMEETEAESARVRAEFEARIKGAEFAADSMREECDKLRVERDTAEQQSSLLQQQHLYLQHELQQTQLQLQHQQQQQQPGPSSMQQVQHQQLLQQAADSSASLDAALRLAQTAQETLARERDELAERVHVLGGENFELTRRTDEAERELLRLESELTRLSSRLRESSESAAAAEAERAKREERRVEREEELMDLRGRVAEREATVERMETELKRIRAELDHAHLSMAETAAVKKEVQHLQQQLEIEREAAATKWQQVMVQLKSYEELASNSGWDSRKTSIDETATVAAAAELRAARAEAEAAAAREELHKLQKAQQTHQQPALQQVQQVQQELPGRAISTEDEEEAVDRHELDMLRARVEELESEVELSHELNVESGRTVLTLQKRLEKAEHEKRLLESLTVEFSEDIADMKEAATAAAPVAAVQPAMDEEEKDELKRKIEEMEEEATLSAELHVEMGRTVQALEGRIKEMEMERRLHEMMNVELTSELHELRQLQQDHLQQQPSSAAEEQAVEAAEAAKQEAQLQQQLEEEKRQRSREQQAAREELHRLQLALHAAEDAKREVARQLAEKEQTESLVRATAATFDAVAAAAGSSSESHVHQPHSVVDAAVAAGVEAENEEERATLVQENVLLREAVYQNVRHSESVTSDVARLLELKEELEKAVGALRGEIWSLNGQLKASVFDRENLQDRVVELDTKVALEKRRADLLDVELAEQVELRENAQRQAAEAENESNRRLAECAEMDGKREDLEKAYALLAGYYSQLQEAYNVLYTQQQQQHANLQHERMLQAAASAEGVSREDRSTQTEAAAAAASPSTSAASVAGHVPSSSSRRAMAEAYASRLAALRELSVQLTKSVLATELATLESELDNSITSIEGLSNDCPEAGASVDSLLDAIIQDYDGSSSVSPDARAKIASVHAMLRAKISEVERVHSALREQRGVCTALEQRLTELEAAGPPPNGIGALGSPGGTSSTAPSELEERIEECEALRAHVEQLQEIISRYVAREEAARLATREADVDSLFRANAELAHENVRLQNELDEEKGDERKEEKEKPSTTSSSTQTHEEKDFDEAELELIREELEAERAERRKVEKRIEETERERIEQQEQLEETIVDLTMQLAQQSTGPAAEEGGATAAERQALEDAAAAAAAEAAALKKDVEREKKGKEGAEKELEMMMEEVEDMRTELQLKKADGEEMKQQLEQAQAAVTAAEKRTREVELQQEKLLEQVLRLQEAKKEKGEDDGWNEGWGEEEKEEEPSPSSQEVVAELRSQLQQAEAVKAAMEELLKGLERENEELQQRMEEMEKRVEAQPVKNAKESDGWNEGWGEDEEKEEEASTSSQELDQLRSKLQQEETARAAAEEELQKEQTARAEVEDQLQQVETEKVQLLQRLQESEKRVEALPVKSAKEDDGWNEGWREEEEKEEPKEASSSELAELHEQLERERKAREEAEEELKKMTIEKKKMQKEKEELEEELEDAKRTESVAREKIKEAEKREEEAKRSMFESERKIKEQESKKKEDDGWNDFNQWAAESSSSRHSEEMKKLQDRLEEEQLRRVEAESYAEQLTKEMQEMEEKMREEREGREEGANWGDGWGEENSSAAELSSLRQQLERETMEKEDLERNFNNMKEIYVNKMDAFEDKLALDRDTSILLERVIKERDDKIKWLESKIEAMENGTEIPPPPVGLDVRPNPRTTHDGFTGPPEQAGRTVYNTVRPGEEDLEDEDEEEDEDSDDEEEEVEYKIDTYVSQDPDELSPLHNVLQDYIREANNLQDQSRSGSSRAIRRERNRLRRIVKGMSEKLQDLEDDYANEGGPVAEGYTRVKNELHAKSLELEKVKKELEEISENLVIEASLKESGQKKEGEKEEIEKVKTQNSLLLDTEAKLSECLDTANTALDATREELERTRVQQAAAVAAATEKAEAEMKVLKKRVAELEAAVNAKESHLAIFRRDLAASDEAKKTAEEKLEKLEKEKQRRKPAGTGAAPAARSYTGGSRRTSAASSRNEEIHEETEQQPPVRVDQAQLGQQVLLEAYRSSLRDLLERVSEYLSEAESRDRSTAVTIDCLQLSVDHVTRQLEMGKKRGARNKRTASAASEADSAATARTEETPPTENVVTTRDSMTESMEDEYMTATVHSAVSDVELAEEEIRHSLIGRTSPAHSPAGSAHNESSHEIREEPRLVAGAEVETQSEGEDEEEVGEIIQKELHATRADVSSLRDGLATFVREMGGWVQQVQQLQSEKDGDKEEMDHLRTEHSQLEVDLERAHVDKEVMETELEQANQAIWHLQQAAKTAAATAAQLEKRAAAAEEAAAAARDQLGVQLEEEEAARERHERERARLREQADELARMLAAADAAAAAATAEAAAAREATRNAKRERDQIENELSTMIEEAEMKIEQLEEELKRRTEEANGAEVRLARVEVELDAARMEAARQSEALQQSAAEREEKEEGNSSAAELMEVVERLTIERDEALSRFEDGKEERRKVEERESTFTRQVEDLRNTCESLTRSLEEVTAEAEIAKAQATALESALGQERQQRAADREGAAAAAAVLEETIEELQQLVQQSESDKAVAVAEHEIVVGEMERKLQQSMVDVEATAAAAIQLQRSMEAVEQQLQQAQLDQAAAAAAEEANGQLAARIDQLEQQLDQAHLDQSIAVELGERILDLEQQLQQAQLDQDAATAAEETNGQLAARIDQLEQQLESQLPHAAAVELAERILELEQQLRQAELDNAAAAAAEETNGQLAARIDQLEQQLEQANLDHAIAVQLGERILDLEQQLQQAQLDNAAAAAAEETNGQLAARIEQLEQQLQQTQQVQPSAIEERARADLEEDIARMEMELAKAQERLESADESTTEANERATASEGMALAARQEVAILRSQLDKMSFEQALLLQGSDEDGPGGGRETTERVRELERQAVERHNEMGQMLEDLRSAEDRAAAATARAAAAAERALAMENTVAELRTQLDESLGETESLRRSMREVHHLEAALQQVRAEQSQLAGDTAVAREQRRVMEEERDAALAQLAEAREQLTQRTEQAIRASANRNESMSRMIEMEQQMNAAAAAAAAAAARAADPTGVEPPAAPSVSRRVSFDLGSREESPAVAIQMPEEEASNLTEEEEEISLLDDELLPRSTLVFASTPSPNVLDQLRSWLRRQARQSRALRGNRALMPYVRYAGALYVVFLQLAFIHCWFF